MSDDDDMEDMFHHAARKRAEEEARAAKKEAMERVEQNANAKWSALLTSIVIRLCMTRPRFSSDDVYDEYAKIADPDKPVTHEPRAFGPVMLYCARMHYCHKANEAPVASRRKSRHAGPTQVWISDIYQGPK